MRHTGQFASASIGYGLAEGVTPERARAAIEVALEQLLLPTDIQVAGAGSRSAGFGPAVPGGAAQEPLLLLAALLLVYLVLGVLYESLLQPLAVLASLPCVATGALIALYVTATPLSLIVLLGLFLLVGLTLRNAILLVDGAQAARRRGGLDASAAIRQAAALRLRPVLLTNAAALLVALPLVLGGSEGSELRQPLGITLVGGLLLGPFLTLYTVPVAYLALDRLRGRRAAVLLRKPGRWASGN